MTITISLLLLCILSLLVWALSSNGKVATLGGFVFTASLAVLLMGVGGARLR